MKVGFFAPPISPAAGGGYTLAADLVEALVRHVPEAEHEFILYVPRGLVPARFPANVSVRHVGATRFSAEHRLLNGVRGLAPGVPWPSPWARRLTRAGVQILWCATPVCPTYDIPFMVPVWDLQHRLQPHFPETSSRSQWSRREALFSEMLGRATFVITGTAVGRQEIESIYRVPSARVRVLPHPTPSFALEATQHETEAASTTRAARPFLFYPAQFWPHKNHVTLVEALASLRRAGKEFDLVLTGADKGNQEHVRSRAVELGVADRVRFQGLVGQSDLTALYRAAAVLVYPSFFGPENLPPLEAFALGCPVVAADVPGAGEQLGDAALLVDPGSPDKWAEAIVRITENTRLRADLVERGRARARRFTVGDFVRGVFGMLDEFAAVRRCWP